MNKARYLEAFIGLLIVLGMFAFGLGLLALVISYLLRML